MSAIPDSVERSLVLALARGNLPQLFEARVRALAAAGLGNLYVLSLIEIGFDDIPWDHRFHRGCRAYALGQLSLD